MKILSALAFAALLSVSLAAQMSDRPVPGDYDGDGIRDLAIVHAGEDGLLYWYERLSSQSTVTDFVTGAQWGVASDQPMPGDYDGDGKTDAAIVRMEPMEGAVWYVRFSREDDGTYLEVQWGVATDVPTSGDFDGDGREDITVFRPSTGVFWVLESRCAFSCYTMRGPIQTL